LAKKKRILLAGRRAWRRIFLCSFEDEAVENFTRDLS
jgi:hypothetical protein